MFGESLSTVKRALNKLEKLKIISRNTSVIKGNGRSNKQRVINLNERNIWNIQNVPAKESQNTLEGSNMNNGRLKNDVCKVHNEPIKDNLKDKKIDNLSKKNADAKKEASRKSRELEDLSAEELMELNKLFKLNDRENYGYLQLKKIFNLKCSLNKDLSKNIEAILAQKEKRKKDLDNKAQIAAMDDCKLIRISNYLNCETDEIEENLSYIDVTADYFLEWLDESHAEVFSIDGTCWIEECEDGNPSYKTYIDFLKMGIHSNPVGVVHNFYN